MARRRDSDEPRLDVRLDAEDRVGGPPPRRSRGDRPRRRKPKPGRRSFFGRLVYWGIVLSIWGVIGVAGLFVWHAAQLPSIQALEVPPRPPDIRIVAADGTLLANRGETGGEAVPLRELPAYLPAAFVAIEDRRFREHFGIDLVGIGRALVTNVMRGSVAQGGSTLTQQLAKNLFLTQERTMSRKLQEAILALWLEQRYGKDQILELYLNRVYFGAGAWGVEAAARRYFGKSARQVTLAEAAMLAGLVRAPSRLAPTRNLAGAQARASVVLAAMADTGAVPDAMAKTALARPATVVPGAVAGGAQYVADWVADLLDDLVGRIEEDVVVVTTIDAGTQTAAEGALADVLARQGTRFDVEQGAIIALAPDGAVRALVGGRSYAESQFNRALQARRQPGSAFKPFVYAAALERGLTPETVRDDRPVDIRGWRPENFSREYLGPVTLTRALALSLNTVAASLTVEIGPRNVIATARRMGISSPLEAVPSLGLGTSEVTPIELVAAYAAFANGGVAARPYVIERVRTAGGRTLWTRPATAAGGRVLAESVVAEMNAMMRETLTTGTARRAELAGWAPAGKTGTSQDFRDAWFVGYTPHLVTGVWLGNDDSSPTRRAGGGGLPVEIWSRVMAAGHRGVPVSELPGLNRPTSPFGPPTAALSTGRGRAGDTDPTRPIPGDNPQALDRWLMERLFGR